MGADKGGTKSGGFFHLFDWNRKSRKKLFSVSPETTKQEKRDEDKLPKTRLHMVDDDEITRISGKGSSDYSCASSVTDEEGMPHRAPGVVARLMGLDSMPASCISEPSSTPFFDTQSLRENQIHKRNAENYINHQFDHIGNIAESHFRKPIEMRSQKMPSSPIERFQTETLPRRSSKSIPLTHHKLLSPIKNPGFISAKNAAYIMEAATKILDSENQPSSRAKISSFGSSSIPIRTSRIAESTKTPTDTIDFKHFRGQPLNRSWNCPENLIDSNSSDVKGKGKSVSLAIQAKVNVQKRECLSSSSRNSLTQKEHNDCNLNQTFKSQPNNQKNKLQRKALTNNASGVLRQNNQKQNCTSSKSKLSSKQSMVNQHGKKVLAGDSTSSTKSKTSNNFSVVSKVDFENEGSSSSYKDFPQKKRLIEKGFVCEKSRFADNVLVNRNLKRVQPNVVIDEHSQLKWEDDNNRNDGADVVSFTFTSPLIKPTPRSRFSTHLVENLNKGDMYCFDTHSKKKDEDKNDKKLFSHGMNVISGDALSILLEQKLKELTSRVEPSSSNSNESVSDHETISTDTKEVFHNVSWKDKAGSIFGYGASSINGQVHGMSKLQEVEECSSTSDARKGLNHQLASPFHALEASFSSGTYDLTENSDITKGIKTRSSSIQAQNNISFNKLAKAQSVETETELSDSASSTLTEISYTSETSSNDLDYVRDVISNTECVFTAYKLNPLLFDKLEDKRRGNDKNGRLKRKMMFDCINECLDVKCSKYFRSGYRAWLKGVAVIGNDELLAKEMHDEILGWKSTRDWMVDELVDKDMSSKLGRWVSYDIEAFEAGIEIEKEIVDSLIKELIADCFMKCKFK